MSRSFIRTTVVSVILLAMGFGVIFISRNEKTQQYLADRKIRQVLAGYADNYVLETLSLLSREAAELNTAVSALGAGVDEQKLAAAGDRWRAVLNRLNETMAFNYGPAAQYDFVKRIASWPFDRVLVSHALEEMAAGRLEMSARYLRKEQYATMRGLYTIEYLLYRNGEMRRVADITEEDLSYMEAAALAVLEDSIDFEAAWLGTENLPSDKAKIMEAAGIPARKAYADAFKSAGSEGNRYLSMAVPLQEIFQEYTGVLEDVRPGIEALEAAGGPGAYWESRDPYKDLISQIEGVKNGYLGGVEGARGCSASDLVADQNPVLDRRVKIALAHTARRIDDIRELPAQAPAEERALAVNVAVAECDKLTARLTAATLLVTMDDTARPWALYGK